MGKQIQYFLKNLNRYQLNLVEKFTSSNMEKLLAIGGYLMNC